MAYKQAEVGNLRVEAGMKTLKVYGGVAPAPKPKRPRPALAPLAEFDLTYLSLGAGVQSTALLIMSALGLHGCPKADVAIFADTGDEPAWVYEHLWKLAEWSPIPIRIVAKGHLSDDLYRRAGNSRVANIPAWTRGGDGRESPLRRQCTREYKIEPIQREVRRLLGLKARQRAAGRVAVRALIGISLDEADRMSPSREAWVVNAFPLVDARMTRRDCFALIAKHGLPEPRKSSCVFCPYHSDAFWKDLKTNHPDEFEKAVRFDRTIRDMSMSGVRRPVFIHRSCKPLETVVFDRQGEMFSEECQGVCGV